MSDITPEQKRKALKDCVRVQFFHANSNKGMWNLGNDRHDGWETDLDIGGYEDLLLKEDIVKLQMYLHTDYFTFNTNKEYRVVKRFFQPCIPVMLCIELEEV